MLMSRAPRQVSIRSRSAASSAGDSSVLSTSKRGVKVNCERPKRAAPRVSCDSTGCVRRPDLAGESNITDGAHRQRATGSGASRASGSAACARQPGGSFTEARRDHTPSLTLTTGSPAPTTWSARVA